MSAFYAVARGKQTGIFTTWPECQNQVKGFSGAVYKKFKTKIEADNFISEKSSEPSRKKQKVELTEAEEIAEILSCNFDDDDDEIELPRKKTETTSKKSGWKPEKETSKKKYGKYIFHEDDDGFVHVYTDG